MFNKISCGMFFLFLWKKHFGVKSSKQDTPTIHYINENYGIHRSVLFPVGNNFCFLLPNSDTI